MFYRSSLEMGTKWSLKSNARDFMLNAIWIVSITFFFFSPRCYGICSIHTWLFSPFMESFLQYVGNNESQINWFEKVKESSSVGSSARPMGQWLWYGALRLTGWWVLSWSDTTQTAEGISLVSGRGRELLWVQTVRCSVCWGGGWLRAPVLPSSLVSPFLRSGAIPVNWVPAIADQHTWVNKKGYACWNSLSSVLLIFSPFLLSSQWKLCACGFLTERLWRHTWTRVRGRGGIPAWCLSAFEVIPSSPGTVLLGGSIQNDIKLDQCKGFMHVSSLSPGLFPNCPSMHTSAAAHGQKLHTMTHKYLQPRPYSSPLWTPKCPKPCEVYKNSVSKLNIQFSE